MLRFEAELLQRAESLTVRAGHKVSEDEKADAFFREGLNAEQRLAFGHITAAGDLKNLVGVAGSGKSRLFAAARQAWEQEGYNVRGMALSGIAAESLTGSSGIHARTIESYEHAWRQGRDLLTPRDILIVDEANMVGTRQLGRVLEAADRAGAKVVLSGDPQQLEAIEAGPAFRAIIAREGAVELTKVRRQTQPWQQGATRKFYAGKTTDALLDYAAKGAVRESATKEQARNQLLDQWAKDSQKDPSQIRIMLGYTRADAHQLNQLAHSVRRERGELGHAEVIKTTEGLREFAVNDRLVFLQNEKSLGVKNGTLGTIARVNGGTLEVRLDSRPEPVSVDTRFYNRLDHGYAITTHKSESMTVDYGYVLATPHYDRNAAYVAMSRHRKDATMFYAAEDFGGSASVSSKPTSEPRARQQFLDVLSRRRDKTFAHDHLAPAQDYRYIETPRQDFAEGSRGPRKAGPATYPDQGNAPGSVMREMDDAQQRAAERWLERQRKPKSAHTAGSELSQEPNLDPTENASTDSRSQQKKRPTPPSLDHDLEL